MTIGITVMTGIRRTSGNRSPLGDWLFGADRVDSQSVLRRRLVRRVFGEDREPDGMVIDLFQQRFGLGRVSVARVVPRIEMDQRLWRQALCPILARQYRSVRKLADVAEA